MKSLGNTALVDLTAGTVEVAPTPDHLVRAFLGGRGLNMFYLYSLLRADVDALCRNWPGGGEPGAVRVCHEWAQERGRPGRHGRRHGVQEPQGGSGLGRPAS